MKKRTVADKIRSMSDDQLAEFMCLQICCPHDYCPPEYAAVGVIECEKNNDQNEPCRKCWLDYLSKSAEEEEQ